MSRPKPVSLPGAFDGLRFAADRRPDTGDAELAEAFAEIAPYRNGGIFIGHYAGESAWERHPNGDEIVYIVEGETSITVAGADGEETTRLAAGDLLVVPQGSWHRFRTPSEVKILTVTPQPTDHSVDQPRP